MGGLGNQKRFCSFNEIIVAKLDLTSCSFAVSVFSMRLTTSVFKFLVRVISESESCPSHIRTEQ